MLTMRTGKPILTNLVLYYFFCISWLFEELSREEAISALQNQPNGTFLVRPSSTIKGDLVLCVKYVK